MFQIVESFAGVLVAAADFQKLFIFGAQSRQSLFMRAVNHSDNIRQNAAESDDFILVCSYLSETGIVNRTAHRAGIFWR